MSAAYAKGIGQSMPNARISHDRFRVVVLANAAIDEVRREEMRSSAAAVPETVGAQSKNTLRQLLWGMRTNPVNWTRAQCEAMHWLQRSKLKSVRAWCLKQALRVIHQEAAASNSEEVGHRVIVKWLRGAHRSRLGPFERLVTTLMEHLGGVVRGMLDGRSNAYVKAMKGLLQQTKTAARGFSHHRQLHRHRLPAYVQAPASTEAPPRMPASPATTGATVMFVEVSISTGNCIEPAQHAAFCSRVQAVLADACRRPDSVGGCFLVHAPCRLGGDNGQRSA